MAAIFYLLTAFTAIWYYRRIVTKGAGKLILGGILPGFRAAFMAFVIVDSLVTGQLTGTNIVAGFGLALLGLVLSFVSKGVGHAKFYSDPSTSFGDQVEATFENPEPPSEGFGL